MTYSFLINSLSHHYQEEETRSAENEIKSLLHRRGFAEEERKNLTLLGLVCILDVTMDKQLCLLEHPAFPSQNHRINSVGKGNVFTSYLDFLLLAILGSTWSTTAKLKIMWQRSRLAVMKRRS